MVREVVAERFRFNVFFKSSGERSVAECWLVLRKIKQLWDDLFGFGEELSCSIMVVSMQCKNCLLAVKGK